MAVHDIEQLHGFILAEWTIRRLWKPRDQRPERIFQRLHVQLQARNFLIVRGRLIEWAMLPTVA